MKQRKRKRLIQSVVKKASYFHWKCMEHATHNTLLESFNDFMRRKGFTYKWLKENEKTKQKARHS